MIELHRRSIATALVCSSPFIGLGTNQARTFGVPDLQIIETPHPVGDLALGDVKARADVLVPELMRRIEKQFR